MTLNKIAQMAHPVGVHLIIATQRPSFDVLSSLTKSNFPTRIAFAVATQVDSRIILDSAGAEKLLGHGDMLYMLSASSKLTRLQGCFASDSELRRLVNFWRAAMTNMEPSVSFNQGASAQSTVTVPLKRQPLWEDVIAQQKSNAGRDELLDKAIEVVQQQKRASVSLLQRKLRIGYSHAARLIDLMEEDGIIGPPEKAGRERKVLIKNDPP